MCKHIKPKKKSISGIQWFTGGQALCSGCWSVLAMRGLQLGGEACETSCMPLQQCTATLDMMMLPCLHCSQNGAATSESQQRLHQYACCPTLRSPTQSLWPPSCSTKTCRACGWFGWIGWGMFVRLVALQWSKLKGHASRCIFLEYRILCCPSYA